jgi:predicted SprT family Zn-dependent metalloprotease
MRTQEYVESLARLWNQPALAGIRQQVNPRLSRSVGRYLPSQNIIHLSTATLAAPARFRREFLCHEAAHAVVWARCGRRARPHGPEWRELVRQAGFEPRASLIRCADRTRPTPANRFRHICYVCHFSRTANRQMPRWRCPECRALGLDGDLRVETVARKR